MVKFKRLVYLLFASLLIVCFSLPLISCSKNELDKVSKGLTNYDIAVTLSDDMKLSGTEKVEYKNKTGNDIDNLCFHLYPRAFRKDATIKPYTSLTLASCFPNGTSYGDIEIKSVKVNEETASWSLNGEDEDILKVDFGYSLENKKDVDIFIEFETTIPNSTHRFGYYNGSINLGNWYPIICVYENDEFDTTPYYSTGDPFYSDIANYNVEITYPSGYLISCTGMPVTSESGNSVVSKITAKAVRDFAIVLSRNTLMVSTDVDNTTINYVGYRDDENLQDYLKLAAKSFKYFNDTFGKYPYSTLYVVKTPFIYGGMEYPNIVLISDAIDDEDEYKKVIVHEIAHQWWYGVVGNNETCEAWLDESLTEFSTGLFFKNTPEFKISYEELIKNAISSYTLYVDVIASIRGSVNTKMNLKLNEYQNDYEYSYMIYVKGLIMFDELKNAVGEKKVISGLRKYYRDNKFSNANKSDFYLAFKEACHRDLETFFEGYLNGSTIITSLS